MQSSELGLAGQRWKYGLIKRGTCGGICELISKIRARSRSTLTFQIDSNVIASDRSKSTKFSLEKKISARLV